MFDELTFACKDLHGWCRVPVPSKENVIPDTPKTLKKKHILPPLSSLRLFTGHSHKKSLSLKTPTSLNKEVRPFSLSDNSIWSYPCVSSLSDYSIWSSGRLF